MKNRDEQNAEPTQSGVFPRPWSQTEPLSPGGNDLEDTLPPTTGLLGQQVKSTPETILYRSPGASPGFDEGAPDQDRVTTPTPLLLPSVSTDKQAERGRVSGMLRAVVGLCLILSLASLVLSSFLIYSLQDVQRTAAEGLDVAIDALDGFGGKGFHYEYRFERTIPVSADIPIQQDLVFPFEGDFPINTTVEVPINAGVLGTFMVEVPINTSIYVNTEVPIHVDQTFHISTSIPVSMTIPIDVKPDDPAIQDLLSQVRAWLLRLRDSFSF